jgi:nucleotide-binding universal stress UspA family protein
MRALLWISEGSWEVCVDRARELLPLDADVTILHVADSEVEYLAEHAGLGRLGRHRAPPGPPIRQIAEAEAHELLDSAQDRFRRPAHTEARRGRVEREVLEACVDTDLLVLVRDGDLRRGPKSLGPRTRFVVDHAGCEVLVLWAQVPPGLDSMEWPRHLR